MLIASLDTKVYKKSCRWQVLDIADLVTARLTIEFRIECVEVLTVKFILNNSQTFTETLIMNNFTFTEEADWIADFRIFYQTQNIIIRSAGFLFCRLRRYRPWRQERWRCRNRAFTAVAERSLRELWPSAEPFPNRRIRREPLTGMPWRQTE